MADLSHRLRTPLTALRIDVESLTDAAFTRPAHGGSRRGRPDGRRRHPGGRTAPCARASRWPATRPRSWPSGSYFWSALADEQGRRVERVTAAGPGCRFASLSDGPVRLRRRPDRQRLRPHSGGHRVPGHACGPRAGGGARLVVADDGPGIARPRRAASAASAAAARPDSASTSSPAPRLAPAAVVESAGRLRRRRGRSSISDRRTPAACAAIVTVACCRSVPVGFRARCAPGRGGPAMLASLTPTGRSVVDAARVVVAPSSRHGSSAVGLATPRSSSVVVVRAARLSGSVACGAPVVVAGRTVRRCPDRSGWSSTGGAGRSARPTA